MTVLISPTKSLRRVACVCLMLVPLVAGSAVTDIANAPLANGLSSNNTVKPNIAFIVDDSGSMNFDDMPNDSEEDNTSRIGNRGNRCFGWSKYNTLFYDPTFTYKPPFKIGGAVYSDGVTRYPNANFSAALKDGYFGSGGYTLAGSSSSNTAQNLGTLTNLTTGAVACVTPPLARATITVSGTGNTSVNNVQVGGVTITSGATSANNNVNTVASRLANAITANGYSATASGAVVTITAPSSTVTATPVISKNGSMNFAASAFASSGPSECATSPSKYYYSTHKTSTTSNTCDDDSEYNIVVDPNQIAGPADPATGIRTATQVEAAKTNYANWYSYYRKRGMILKAAVGEAFKDLDESKYRVGLFFINSIDVGVGTRNNDFKIADFSGTTSGTQRFDWYSKLYAGRANGGTPLRGAVSRVGRMYAGQISGWDPVQYSCQQNFAILSTDGFWTSAGEGDNYGPKQVNGSSNVGNTDAAGTAAVPAKATIDVSNDNRNGAIAQITVGGLNLMASASSPTTSSSSVASRVAALINQNGFSATSSNRRITVTAPTSQPELRSTPLVVNGLSGTVKTYSASAFSGYVASTTGAPLPYTDNLGQSNTLADVSYYFYQTDLRTAELSNCSNTIGSTSYTNLCDNNVRGSGRDQNPKQHLTTFTVGLGVSGTVQYQSDYETAAEVPGQTTYFNIKNGTANWPAVSASNDNDIRKIDDLWHTAVNGRGTYYSASNANTLRAGLQSALASVQAQTGSSAAAATSSQQPVAGDNFAYVALYRTLKWDGDLQAYAIDPNTGSKTGGVLWSAKERLDAQVAEATSGEGRSIKYFSSGELTKLKDFTYANLTTDGLQANFNNLCNKTPLIAQCATNSGFSDAQKATMNSGSNLVNYLRGNATYEDETSNATVANRLYRGREHVLGDIVNSEPVYVKKAPFPYDKYDLTYGTFKTNSAGRLATVYTAGNDGMLHAFKAGAASGTDGTEGQERWAYVPRLVMSNMWQLANSAYGDNHRYYVDGSPTLADICTSLATADAGLCANTDSWKTILVGGLNKGGCGYYALDVTNPSAPKGLWEFTNANLGYSFGKPIVTKNKNGRWIVLIASGYNNYSNNGCGSTGDGNGHLFVLDAATGDLLDDIPTYTTGTTPAGTPSSPSGLAYLNAWVEDPERPIAKRAYAGDLLGNVWRFDFDLNYGTEKKAYLMATLQDGASTPNRQPITTRLELASVTSAGTTYPLVLVGSGKYLGDSDLSDTKQQSLYGLKDNLSSTTLNVRDGTLKSRTFTEVAGTTGGALDGRTIRKITGDTLDWSTDNGWYFDFNPSNLSPGERLNIQMSLDSSILTFATNVPSANACNVGGYAYLYSVDVNNGKALANAIEGAAGVKLVGNALVAGIRTITLPSGKKVVLITDTAGGLSSDALPSSGDGIVGTARRTSWREIID
ncbi:PilC/PilY family type IV pilus protein [uncultured Oxalicibacterium sp.]|uniref:PilC/PilY family type IV pilus protein n=1 Tax=uncultured Oxalicibacterium sp. TaxID=1168540 RepID=UPI0025CB9C0C|nr:PilC/PilY family type IV pilus protein [uncultured Oxalicibacterium sp.]